MTAIGTAADTSAAATAARPVDRTAGFRRRGAALALPFGFVLQLAANATYAWVTRNGGDDSTGAHSLALYGAHPGALQFANGVALLGSLLIVPGVLAALRVLRASRPVLSLIAGILVIAGYISYVGVNSMSLTVFGFVQHPGANAAAALDAAMQGPVATVMALIFVVGNLLGMALLGLAVLLSREVPWWAGAAILCWTVAHIVGLVVGSEWFEVGGGVVQIVGLSVLAAAALRLPLDEWRIRG